MIDINNPPKDQRGKCPRCEKDRLWVGDREVFNALSRKDNKTMICSPCGKSEALEIFAKATGRRP